MVARRPHLTTVPRLLQQRLSASAASSRSRVRATKTPVVARPRVVAAAAGQIDGQSRPKRSPGSVSQPYCGKTAWSQTLVIDDLASRETRGFSRQRFRVPSEFRDRIDNPYIFCMSFTVVIIPCGGLLGRPESAAGHPDASRPGGESHISPALLLQQTLSLRSTGATLGR